MLILPINEIKIVLSLRVELDGSIGHEDFSTKVIKNIISSFIANIACESSFVFCVSMVLAAESLAEKAA